MTPRFILADADDGKHRYRIAGLIYAGAMTMNDCPELVGRLEALSAELYAEFVKHNAAAHQIEEYGDPDDVASNDEAWMHSREAELYLDLCHRIQHAIKPPQPDTPEIVF